MAETTAPVTGDRRRLTVVATAGLIAIALLVWMTTGQTTAGFTATTDNAGNLFETGSITITGDPANGQVLLTAPALLPGDSVTGDITITNGSEAPLKLKIFSADLVETPSTSGISDSLDIEITRDGAAEPFFVGTMADLANSTDFTSGVAETAGGDPLAKASETANSVTYTFTVTLNEAAGMDAANVNQLDEAVIKVIFEGRA